MTEPIKIELFPAKAGWQAKVDYGEPGREFFNGSRSHVFGPYPDWAEALKRLPAAIKRRAKRRCMLDR